MIFSKLIKAGFASLSLCVLTAAPLHAQNVLKVMRAATSSSVKVSVNRAVVMESDQPFAELSVANPGIADIATLSDRTIYILGKSQGRTTLTLLGGDGRLITNVDVRVTPDVTEFKEILREILPSEKIEVRTANDGIVLSGRVSGKQKLARALELAERYAPGKVTNLMSVGGSQQVMLKVRFAEMQRSVSKSLNSSIGIGGVLGNTAVAGATGQTAQGGNYNALFDSESTSTYNSANDREGAFTFSFGAGGLSVNLLLEALESKGMVRTLAEPNLIALSGSKASFLAGGEYPIPVSSAEGTTTVEYRPFGVELDFTPIVLDGDLINLTIRASVSSVDTSRSVVTNGFAVNAFKKRDTSTIVEMRDGQSFAIAGLLQDDFTDLNGQVPWLGDIPILGSLFRSAEFSRNQTELVVIVTPHLVTATSEENLALPTDRVRIPSEAEFFLNGKVAVKNKSSAGSVASQDFQGSYGYVME